MASRKMLLRSASASSSRTRSGGADVRRLDRQPGPEPGQELLHDAGSACHLPLVPAERDLVPAGDDPEGELRLEQAQVLVVPAEEGPEVDLGGKREAVGGGLSHAVGSRPPSQPLGYHTRRTVSICRCVAGRHPSPARPAGSSAPGRGTATSRASSWSCAGPTGVGASVKGHVPFWVLGNAMTSRMDSDAGQDGDDPVEPERDAAHRRSAVLQRLQEEPELGPRVGLADPEELEDPLLERPRVDADRAPADLLAVQDEIVGLGARAAPGRPGRLRRPRPAAP